MANVQSTWEFVELLQKAMEKRRMSASIGPVVAAKATSTTGVVVVAEQPVFVKLCFEARDSLVDCHLVRRRANGRGVPESWNERVHDDVPEKDKIRIYVPPPGWPIGRHSYRERVKKTIPEFVEFAIAQYVAAMARVPDEWRG
jgi:hypothetical protein